VCLEGMVSGMVQNSRIKCIHIHKKFSFTFKVNIFIHYYTYPHSTVFFFKVDINSHLRKINVFVSSFTFVQHSRIIFVFNYPEFLSINVQTWRYIPFILLVS